MSATALGTGAVIVVAAGLGVSIARTGDEGAIRPAAGAASASPSVTSSPAPAATPTTAATTPTAAPAAPSDRQDGPHSGAPAAGQHHPGHQQAGGIAAGATGTLPFTGTPPVPATTALGILLTLAGSWTLVRVPGAPGEVPGAVADVALDRLRRRRAD